MCVCVWGGGGGVLVQVVCYLSCDLGHCRCMHTRNSLRSLCNTARAAGTSLNNSNNPSLSKRTVTVCSVGLPLQWLCTGIVSHCLLQQRHTGSYKKLQHY